jgi:signal transduction histidine kinase/ActR/RegA family two-component response regulator
MISNNLVIPLLLRYRRTAMEETSDAARHVLLIRRAAIVAVMLLAYAYYRMTGGAAALASIGLLSFAALAQFAPAFFGGLIWRGATARGAIAGMVTGFAVWGYTLLLPAFVQSGLLPNGILENGPFGLAFLRPQSLLGLSDHPLAHGVFWSLGINAIAFVGVSLSRRPEPIERLQANIFVPQDIGQAPGFRLWRTTVTAGDLMETAARYVGAERAERAYRRFAEERHTQIEPHRPADVHILRFTEQLLTSAIGASSSRIVLSLLMKRRDPSAKSAFKLIDDASAAIQYNRDLLQTALDQVAQGIAVFDRDLRLVCWNRQFRILLGTPDEVSEVGTPLDAIIRQVAYLGAFGRGEIDQGVAERIARMAGRHDAFREAISATGAVVEVRTSPMPDGGLVATFTDITESVKTEETLERRVSERTEELTRVNEALVKAKAAADEANIGKTRFLAGAGHDILQPLNAARLYATSLVERTKEGPERTLVNNIDTALEAVEGIIGAILDISRLDTGALTPEISAFRLDEVLAGIAVDFAPLARGKGLDFRVLPSKAVVRSDRRLLRRLLQNLVSNAIKYTPHGRVLIGCRRRGGSVLISVYDTGVGIPAEKRYSVFEEFSRLDDTAGSERGLGLGLSIVERISRVLGHPIDVESEPGKGSHFSVGVPVAEAASVPPESEPEPPLAGVGGALVLCVDNDRQILDGLHTLLTGWDCAILAARSTEEAVEALAKAPRLPDLAIIDFHLDIGDGIATTATLRERFDADLAVVLITADRSPDVKAAALRAGIPILHKPVRPAALRAALAQARLARSIAAE